MDADRSLGKKRAFSEQSDGLLVKPNTSTPTQSERKVKKPKRAETRTCPVCEDTIPVRLLASHEEFELQRVDEICHSRLEDVALVPWEQIEEDILNAAGPSRRGAALKARRSFNPNQSRTSLPGSGMGKPDLLAKVSKTLKLVQRHRRDRHVRLKELSKADLEDDDGSVGTEKRVCPVCQTVVSGDADVVEAHVDACLAHAVTAAASNGADLEADGLEEYEVGGETRIRIARSVDFRGAGFDVRNPLHNDVEDEIDIDGDDAVVFGDTQFTEKDIIFPDSMNSTEDEEIRIDSDDEQDHIRLTQRERVGTSLRDLVAQGKVVLTSNVEGETTSAIVSTDSAALGGLMCRICLDAYTEPTVSTGCWHTCCKECWLRCLGSTKLCPICKRITAAGDLRRIYL
ncbi:hypothetical protein JB92DRAFT_3087609 [Gautieria morchelliformis]|nr:hypothetical protein JB92DRAFT_3087609 [Gautieria morchelliformis]